MQKPKYKRVVLKLSGEALAGSEAYGIDHKTLLSIGEQVVDVVKQGVEVAIVVGGGNIWRGVAGSAQGMDRATADYMACWLPRSMPWPCRMLSKSRAWRYG